MAKVSASGSHLEPRSRIRPARPCMPSGTEGRQQRLSSLGPRGPGPACAGGTRVDCEPCDWIGLLCLAASLASGRRRAARKAESMAVTQWQVVAQSVELRLHFAEERVEGTAQLWLAYTPLAKSADSRGAPTKLRLHCRQCAIWHIEVDGAPTTWRLTDLLRTIVPAEETRAAARPARATARAAATTTAPSRPTPSTLRRGCARRSSPDAGEPEIAPPGRPTRECDRRAAANGGAARGAAPACARARAAGCARRARAAAGACVAHVRVRHESSRRAAGTARAAPRDSDARAAAAATATRRTRARAARSRQSAG